LEQFWESEVPRIGEPDAKGWAAWDRSGRPEYVSQTAGSTPRNHGSAETDSYRRWAIDESAADRTMDIPTRSADDTDDPYSTILFSDIKDLLVSLESMQVKYKFRLIWLSFLGLHIPGFSASLSEISSENLDDRWCDTHLITSSYLRSIFPPDVMSKRITAESHSGVLVGGEKQYSNSFGPVHNWGYGAVNPLDDQNHSLWSHRDVGNVRADFVRKIFEQCRMGNEDVEWDTLAITFEAAINVKRSAAFPGFLHA
jgi:hypothetical protein